METEYIEKQAAISLPVLPKEHRGYQTYNLDDAFETGWYELQRCIEEIPPAADVRPVVLCKDCDLWNEWDSSGRESLGNYRCSCAEWTTEITTYYTGPDEFCSRGVRRDSDG